MTKKAYLSLVLLFLLFCLTYLGIAKTSFNQQTKTTILDLLYLVPPALAVAGTALAARKAKDKESSFWLYLTVANALLFLGELIWIPLTLLFF